eukprot:g5454.t1
MGKAWNDFAVATDKAHSVAVCSNRGFCDRTNGICVCLPGFEGRACDRLSCPGFPKCSGHGRCLSQKRMGEQKFGMTYNHWDGDMIYGCLCDESWTGYDCSERMCPTGDDVMTTGQTNEVQLLSCDYESVESKKTHFYLGFRNSWSPPIYWNDTADIVQAKIEAMTTIDMVEVRFLVEGFEDAKYMCGHSTGGGTNNVPITYNNQPQVARIQFLRQFGDLEPLQIQTHKPGPTVKVACDTYNPWYFCPDTEFQVVQSSGSSQNHVAIRGDKEEETCSGRGECDITSGICSCYMPFFSSDGDGPRNPPATTKREPSMGLRGECGYRDPAGSVYNCAGEIPCMGHGVCSYNPAYKCTCSNGWTGAVCDLRTCPYGKAWFSPPEDNDNAHALMECSNRGICERDSGQCFCQDMMEGDACDHMKCPGTVEQEEWGMCSGHGDCLYMWELAQRSTVNGDATNYTYGEKPNDEGRWDFDQIQGCACDPGYEGINCASRTCLRTDDKNTIGHDEVQNFECYASHFQADATDSVKGGGCFSAHKNKRLDEQMIQSPKQLLTNYVNDFDSGQADLQWALKRCREEKDCAGVSQYVEDGTQRNIDGTWPYRYDLQKYETDGSSVKVPALIHKAGATLFLKEKCTFALSFRQQQTNVFTTDATAAEVEIALNNLPNIVTGGVKLLAQDPTGTGILCPSNQNNSFQLTFSKNFGDLPLVKFITQDHGWWNTKTLYEAAYSGNLNSRAPVKEGVIGTETVKGTKEDALCGNHGTCDYTTGECQCYQGYSSSDGDGGRGSRNDCGFRVPILNAAANTDEG